MKRTITAAGFLLMAFAGCATKPSTVQTQPTPTETAPVPSAEQKGHGGMGTMSVPKDNDLVLLDHKIFKILYSKKYRIAKHVKYVLEAKNLGGPAKRRNKFIPDPLLVEQGIDPVRTSMYSGTGYDRGHLAPSEDFTATQADNDLTFLMSNMTPQKPKLNEDAWKRLETQVRKWACGEDRVLITSGPIFENGMGAFKSGVAIPRRFFKVIIDDTPPRKALAFIYKQEDKGDVLKERVVSFSSLKEVSGETFEDEVPRADWGIFHQTPILTAWKSNDCSKKKKVKVE